MHLAGPLLISCVLYYLIFLRRRLICHIIFISLLSIHSCCSKLCYIVALSLDVVILSTRPGMQYLPWLSLVIVLEVFRNCWSTYLLSFPNWWQLEVVFCMSHCTYLPQSIMARVASLSFTAIFLRKCLHRAWLNSQRGGQPRTTSSTIAARD